MDFSRLKDLIIPEGNVVRIVNGDVVLWEKVVKYVATKYKASVTEEYGIYTEIPVGETTGDYGDGLVDVHRTQTVHVHAGYSLNIYDGFVGSGYIIKNYNELDGYYNFEWNHASSDREAEMRVFQYKLLSQDSEYAHYEQVPVAAARKEYLGQSYSTGEQVGDTELTANEIRELVSRSEYIEASGGNYTVYVYESNYYAYRFTFDPRTI